MNLFEHLENICYHKKSWHKLSEEERKTANAFMINRFLSMEYKYLDIVNEIQTLNLPLPYLYNLYIGIIPKQKKFLKYIKKSVKEIGEKDDIKIISKLFQISEREAQEYIDKLQPKQIEELKLQMEGIKKKNKKKK